MISSRYPLCPPHENASTGITDLKQSRGSIIDTSGCVLLLVTAGCAVASINFRRFPLRRGCMVLFFYDEVFLIERTSADFSTRYAVLSYEIAERAILDVPSPHFWDILYRHPVYMASAQEWKLLNNWWEQLHWIRTGTESNYRDALLKTHFHTLLLAMDSKVAALTLPPLEGDMNRQWKLVTDFFRLVTRHCRTRRDVRFFADELCISTSYLYKLCRDVLHTTPKALIDNEAISEIKSFLSNSDLSVKKIAEEMSFDDDSYLCRFFRRHTGRSPASYRNLAAYDGKRQE